MSAWQSGRRGALLRRSELRGGGQQRRKPGVDVWMSAVCLRNRCECTMGMTRRLSCATVPSTATAAAHSFSTRPLSEALAVCLRLVAPIPAMHVDAARSRQGHGATTD